MSEMKRPSLEDDGANLEPANSQESERRGSSEIAHDPNDNHINGDFRGNGLDHELPERTIETEGRRSLMSGMPSINLSEMMLILRDPRMPSHKVMNKAADKIELIGDEIVSDDGSVDSTGGFVGFQGVMNCIFDAAIQIVQPGNSDDEDEDLERNPLKYSCNVCNKAFGNNMESNTHVLVAHQHPSVLNINSLSRNVDSRDKAHAHRRRHSKTLTRPEARATRVQPTCVHKLDSQDTARLSRVGAGALSGQNSSSSESRLRHSGPHEKPRSARDRVGAASLPTEQTRKPEPSSSCSTEPSQNVDCDHNTAEATPSEDSTPQSRDLPVTDDQHKPDDALSRDTAELSQNLPVTAGGCSLTTTADSCNLPDGASQGVATDQTQSPVTDPVNFSSGESDTHVESPPGRRRHESPAGDRAESPARGRTESPVGDRTESPAGCRHESPAGDRAESSVGDRAESSAGDRAESSAGDRAESSAEDRAESQKSEKNLQADGRDQASSTSETTQEDSINSSAPLSKKCYAGEDDIEGRKRKASSPLPEPSSSSSFKPKRSKKHVAVENESDTPQKHVI